jgi:hypothetical protein
MSGILLSFAATGGFDSFGRETVSRIKVTGILIALQPDEEKH